MDAQTGSLGWKKRSTQDKARRQSVRWPEGDVWCSPNERVNQASEVRPFPVEWGPIPQYQCPYSSYNKLERVKLHFPAKSVEVRVRRAVTYRSLINWLTMVIRRLLFNYKFIFYNISFVEINYYRMSRRNKKSNFSRGPLKLYGGRDAPKPYGECRIDFISSSFRIILYYFADLARLKQSARLLGSPTYVNPADLKVSSLTLTLLAVTKKTSFDFFFFLSAR